MSLVQSVTNVPVHSPFGAICSHNSQLLNGVVRRNRTAAMGDGELQGLKGGRDFRPLSACCWALLPGREVNLSSNKKGSDSPVAQHSPEKFSLVERVVKRIMVAVFRYMKCLRDLARLGFGPRCFVPTHVEGLYVQPCEAKRVLSQKSVEVVVDERPVKRCVKSDENRDSVTSDDFSYPLAELSHSICRICAPELQIGHRQSRYLKRLRICIHIDRPKLKGESQIRRFNGACAQRQHAELAGNWTRCLNINRYNRLILHLHHTSLDFHGPELTQKSL